MTAAGADQISSCAGRPRHPAGHDLGSRAGRRAAGAADLRPLSPARRQTRIDTPESVPGASRRCPTRRRRDLTGISLPLQGQPVQGLSGIKNLKDGTFLTLTDNGFGSKANSPDAMLMFHVVKPDWKSRHGRARLDHASCSDPDRKVPFRIVNENTPSALPAPARDFDIEIDPADRRRAVVRRRVRPVPDQDRQERQGAGRVRDQGRRQGRALARQSLPGDRRRAPGAGEVRGPAQQGLRGHGGLARRQVPLSAARRRRCGRGGQRASRRKDGKAYLRILEFDVDKGAFTGKSWKYPLEAPTNAIGDFNLIDATSGLIIERDDSEGDPAQACLEGAPSPTASTCRPSSSASTRSTSPRPTPTAS